MAVLPAPAAEAEVEHMLRELEAKKEELKALRQAQTAAPPATAKPAATPKPPPAAAANPAAPAEYKQQFPGWRTCVGPLLLLLYLSDGMSRTDAFMAGAFLVVTMWFGQKMVNRLENSEWRHKLRTDAAQAVAAQEKEDAKKEAKKEARRATGSTKKTT